MKRGQIAAAAIALAASGAALAQSNVTISGRFKAGVDHVKLGQSAASRNSEVRVTDDGSFIRFNVTEDLGGGVSAIGQFDLRPVVDSGALFGNGNNHVGLRSKSWGRLFLGRQELHWFNTESDITFNGPRKSDSASILAFAGGGATAIAGATRTSNVIHYTTPQWGPLTLIAAYSSAPGAAAAEADLRSGIRSGSAWNLHPNFKGANWQAGYSYWTSKFDGAAATNAVGGADQRGDRLYGSYRWGGFKIGLAWDKSKLKGALNGARLSERSAWSIPMSYTWGPHEVHAHFDKARDDRATAAQDGAKMLALAYGYSLSKRTAIVLTYAKITNDAGAFYNLFTSAGGLGSGTQSATGVGSTGAGVDAGEDPRVLAVNITHRF